MNSGFIVSFLALVGFASQGVYLIRRRGFATTTGKTAVGLAAAGVFASLVNTATPANSLPESALQVGTTFVVLLIFLPLCPLLAGHLPRTRMWAASLGGLFLFITSRLIYPVGNGAVLAGILGLALLVICLFQFYPSKQTEKNSGAKNRLNFVLAAWSVFLAGSFFLLTGLMSLSLLGMAIGGALSAFLINNAQLPDFRSLFNFKRTFRSLSRLLPTSKYNPNQVLREFSFGISNITSPELLATVSIGLISEALELSRGCLFIVDYETGVSGSAYRLQFAGGMGQVRDDLKSATLKADNPTVQYFKQARRPLLFEDFSRLAGFTDIPTEEQQWFAALGMEVFAPVHTKEQWIGFICLGPKQSGAGYNQRDLVMIETLADQLSLALQNARLIDSIMRVNNDFRRAYTAMEQSNHQLRQAINQLEKIDRTKTDFISVVSHELRTPLTLIRGYTEILLEEETIRENEFQAKTVSGIYNGILRFQEILESMLDVASLDASSFSLSIQPVSISQVISSLKKKSKPVLEERKLSLVVENLSHLPAVDGDGVALTKVFSNLLMNAIKYTPDGGTITISGVLVSPGQLGLAEGGIEIIIADTGIGIDKENLELIFHKFFQTGQISLHSSGKTKYRGSGPGLGLALAKGIIEAHGGKIWAESKGFNDETFPGSQFHVILPHSKPGRTDM